VNVKGGQHYTALHAAVKEGHEKIVRTFLEHGADVNAMGGYDGTPLYLAKKYGREEAIINLLLQYGAEDRPPIKWSYEEEIDWEDTDSRETVSD
jgi:hypothetical protein